MILRIGVDGGATKTECILVDAAGKIVGRHLAPGSNPSVVGPDAAGRIVRDALTALRRPTPGPIEATLLCMAGAPAFWQNFAAQVPGFGRVVATTDAAPILEIGTRGRPGLVLHAGTGSFVAARRNDGGAESAGRLGWRLGDEGSGYDIGRRALARGLLELQGWESPSRLGALLREQMGHGDAAVITRYFYEDPAAQARIAAWAPAVLGLAGADEPVALGLVLESVGGLLQLATKVAAKLFPDLSPAMVRVGVSGPILTHPSILPELRTRSPFNLEPVEGSPIEGVRRLVGNL